MIQNTTLSFFHLTEASQQVSILRHMPLSYFLILDEVFLLVLMMGEAVMSPADPIEKGKVGITHRVAKHEGAHACAVGLKG